MADGRLSTELWTRVFEYVSVSRRDVANCRLVCSSFAAVAAEFLVRRIVITKRSKSLQRAWDILEHPMFRFHVRELVYDFASYNFAIATKFPTYTHVSRAYPWRAYLREGLKGREQSCADLLRRIPERSEVGDLLPTATLGPEVSLELFSGYIEYAKQCLDYETVVRKKAHFTTLRHALSRLPKLRWIHFTDFRHLAAPGESYHDLTRRLFGDILEPNLNFPGFITELLNVFKIVKEEPQARIHGFRIGGHQYENWAEEECLGSPYHHYPDSSLGLPFKFLNHDHSDDDVFSYIPADLSAIIPSYLKYLRLPVRIPVDEILDEAGNFDPASEIPGSSLKKLLQITAPTLVSLELWASADFYSDQDHNDPIYIESAQALMTALLEGLAFTSLQRLEFGNWELPEEYVIREFFSEHSSTLKEVRVLECKFSEDPFPLGEWIGQNMNLTGVEIECKPWQRGRYETGNANKDGQATTDDEEDADETLCGNRSDKIMDEDGERLVWWWIKGREQLEELWLAGRHNNI